jgi:glucose/arabinose dehydrogenase
LEPSSPRRPAAISVLLAVTLVLACGGKPRGSSLSPTPPVADSAYEAVRVAAGLSDPVDLQAPPGDTTRVFLVEKTGLIRILRDGALLARPFLDLTAQVSGGSEQGLLGLAFHPQYASNGRFFVQYTDKSGDSRVVGFNVSTDPDSADPGGSEVLFVDQPYSNHNGGQMAFGPDGFLYVALGDGGDGGDPQGNGQSLATLLGKILRLDVDAGAPYTVPSDNPFVGQAGARGEIWSYGWRNPWRFAFDAETGDLWVGDVGQNAWEEIDVEPAATAGRNYGWKIMEGDHCYAPAANCDTTGLVRPLLEYGHGEGCSVTGGYVYRGEDLPELHGSYFYGDFCTGLIRSVRLGPGGGAVEPREWTSVLRRADGGAMEQLASFGVDGRGELYLLLLDGDVYRLRRKP